MGINILVILLCSGLLTMMVLLIAAKPKYAIRISGIFSVIAAVGGLLIYGYGFAATVDDLILACVQTLISVCGMFVAAFDFSAISDAPLFQHTWAQIVYWVIHLMAFYATVSAALSTFGAGFLGRLRLRFRGNRELFLIYGAGENALEYGRNLLSQGRGVVLYVAENAAQTDAEAIADMGAIIRYDDDALNPSDNFLKSIGIFRGKRKLTLCALGENKSDNLYYAAQLLIRLEKSRIKPEQTSLVIHGREASNISQLQNLGDRYGYGFVTAYQEPDLAARLLTMEYPPCNAISFDGNGRAEQDFEAVIIGFGQVGQAVLKSLICNGQFVGSRFSASVIAPDWENVTGSVQNLVKNYAIDFHSWDARSANMYEYLRSRGDRVRYLVVCAGTETMNQEIAETLVQFLEEQRLELAVYQCSSCGVKAYDPETGRFVSRSLYEPHVLSARSMDQMAMVINHYYQGSGGISPVADWMKCDFFSRMSCRASADFMDAMLKASGKTEAQVLAGDWNLSAQMLENLSIMEHLRWCAFHFCMGFRPMSQQEYDRRTAQYLAEKAEKGASRLRIGKNMENRTHACLVDWEQLDALSERESAITGKAVNYKVMDTDNVMAVPRMLEIRKNLRG